MLSRLPLTIDRGETMHFHPDAGDSGLQALGVRVEQDLAYPTIHRRTGSLPSCTPAGGR